MDTVQERRRDRRQVRRAETIEQILDLALELMGEHGAGGLSLGQLARRMGMATPSLYVYFDSKNALYDALFARGWAQLHTVMRPTTRGLDSLRTSDDLHRFLLAAANRFVRWAVQHPAYAQLMFWRPVPGYAPSPAAYAEAVEVSGLLTQVCTALLDRGLLCADTDLEEATSAWTVLLSGVISQQLSNGPGESFGRGRFTRRLPQLVQMYVSQYASPDIGNAETEGST